jgi:hypothetical protein
MELLPDELRQQLPPIREIHPDEGQCIIYAKLFTYSGVAFYVAEGEQRGEAYLLWGLLIAPQFKFSSRFQISLSRLEGSNWLGKERCKRDEDFKPARWEALERAIPNLRQPRK